ncbi:MAG: hypothetical protein HYS27_21975 [Deltaproteobacteria bacterium]|nr:hypothetical protein [Deltaproteobacteria bacterium]
MRARRRGRRFLLLVLLAGLCVGMSPAEPPPTIPIVAVGANQSSIVVVERLLAEMRVSARLEPRLRRANLTLVVVPRRALLTELPQFASLRGRRTFDGRPWEQVRGTGGVLLADGSFAVAVPEENVLFGWADDAYPALSIAVHEIAHALHDRVLDEADHRRIEDAFAARRQLGGPFVDAYAASNAREYFAQGVNAFFGRYPGFEERDARWLFHNDRQLYAALAKVFGPPPDRRYLTGRAPINV